MCFLQGEIKSGRLELTAKLAIFAMSSHRAYADDLEDVEYVIPLLKRNRVID